MPRLRNAACTGLLVVLAAGAVVAVLAATGPAKLKPDPVATSQLPTPDGTAPRPPPECGSWPALRSISAQYGPGRSCFLDGPYWLYFTQGSSKSTGVVAEFSCLAHTGITARNCRAGRMTNPPLRNWAVLAPPFNGAVTPLGLELANHPAVILDVAGHQITFNPVTGRFTTGP